MAAVAPDNVRTKAREQHVEREVHYDAFSHAPMAASAPDRVLKKHASRLRNPKSTFDAFSHALKAAVASWAWSAHPAVHQLAQTALDQACKQHVKLEGHSDAFSHALIAAAAPDNVLN